MENYNENVMVLLVDKNEITYEENIVIKIKTFTLNCFVSNFLTKGDFKKGEITKIKLSLMTTELNKITSNELNIASTEFFENHCILSGLIKNFVPIYSKYIDTKSVSHTIEDTDYKYGIVDCGINVFVEFPVDTDLKIGDFISAEGRLDAQKILD